MHCSKDGCLAVSLLLLLLFNVGFTIIASALVVYEVGSRDCDLGLLVADFAVTKISLSFYRERTPEDYDLTVSQLADLSYRSISAVRQRQTVCVSACDK